MWEQFNDAEIREMFDLCSDPESELSDPLLLCWDMERPFPACVLHRLAVVAYFVDHRTGNFNHAIQGENNARHDS